MSLSRKVIERRFGLAAYNLRSAHPHMPVTVKDIEKALHDVDLPIALVEENDLITKGVFVWAYCPGNDVEAQEHRIAAIDRIEQVVCTG